MHALRLDAAFAHLNLGDKHGNAAYTGIDPYWYANRERSADEYLPWARIDVGVTPKFLWSEREASRREVLSPDCREKCLGCGAVNLMKGGCCDE